MHFVFKLFTCFWRLWGSKQRLLSSSDHCNEQRAPHYFFLTVPSSISTSPLSPCAPPVCETVLWLVKSTDTVLWLVNGTQCVLFPLRESDPTALPGPGWPGEISWHTVSRSLRLKSLSLIFRQNFFFLSQCFFCFCFYFFLSLLLFSDHFLMFYVDATLLSWAALKAIQVKLVFSAVDTIMSKV